MQITTWLASLKPYLRILPITDLELPGENPDAIFYNLSCSKCSTQSWLLQVFVEPVFQRTHWKVLSKCVQCLSELQVTVFNANDLGWNYPDARSTEFNCPCGNNDFRLTLVFEPYEEEEIKNDMSWFWLWSKCNRCGQQHKIVDWELD